MSETEEMHAPAPQSPSSWRDVYTLVQDVEQRLTRRMDEIADTAKNAVTDHEIRIRVLERTDLQSEQRNKAIVTGISIGRSTLLTIMTVGSMIVSIIAVLSRPMS